MARLWSAGADLAWTTDWTAVANAPTDTAHPRTGTYAYKMTATDAASCSLVKQVYAADAARIGYMRDGFYLEQLGSTQPCIILEWKSSGGSGLIYSLITTAGVVELRLAIYAANALLATGPTIGVGAHTQELKYDAINDVVSWRVNGVEYATDVSVTITTWGGATVYPGFTTYKKAAGGTDWIVHHDDIAINDDTGSFQTSWCGLGKLVTLRPNAAGASAVWTRGGTDTGANWSQTSEIPPDDATTFVHTVTTGDVDDYNLDATPSEMLAQDIVSVVHCGGRYRGSSASAAANSSFVFRIKDSGGNLEESAILTPATTVWQIYAPVEPKLPNLTLYDLPGGSTLPWTKAELDGAQAGVRTTTGRVVGSDVSALWVMFEWTPLGLGWKPQEAVLPRQPVEVVSYG